MKTLTKGKKMKIKLKSKLLKKFKRNMVSSKWKRSPHNYIAVECKNKPKGMYRANSTDKSRFRTTVTSNGNLNSLGGSQKYIEFKNEINKNNIEKEKRSNPDKMVKSPYYSNMDTEKFKALNKNKRPVMSSHRLKKLRKRTNKHENVLDKFSRLMKKTEVNEFFRTPKDRNRYI